MRRLSFKKLTKQQFAGLLALLLIPLRANGSDPATAGRQPPDDHGTVASATMSGGTRLQRHFKGVTDFSDWQTVSLPGQQAGRQLISPVFTAPFAFDQLILSWNVSRPGSSAIRLEVSGIYPDRRTKYFVLGNWSTTPTIRSRESVPNQQDADGDVLTDTLVWSQPCSKYQVRITQIGAAFADDRVVDSAELEFLGISILDSQASLAERTMQPIAWGQKLDVPCRSQLAHAAAGGRVWCSPTSVSMVLAYWSRKLGRAELDIPVPTVARAVHDPNWPGTGNWPFNTAFAGTFPGIRAYVDRLEDLASLERWIARDIPVVVSVVRSILDGQLPPPGTGGHLVVCVGFSDTGDVWIHDPWADPDRLEQVEKRIPRADFDRAWLRSKHTAYLIFPTQE